MSSHSVKTNSLQYSPFTYSCADYLNEHLKPFPFAKHLIYGLVRKETPKHEPDLLESINILGSQVASVGLGLSLCSFTLLPAVGYLSLMVIFKKTVKELRQRKKDTQKIEELSEKIDTLKEMIKASQINAKSIRLTTKKLKQLKEEEKELLKELQKTKDEYNLIAKLLKKECGKFSQNNKDLIKQVNRLSRVKK